jgi:hypothetical protein
MTFVHHYSTVDGGEKISIGRLLLCDAFDDYKQERLEKVGQSYNSGKIALLKRVKDLE